MCCEVVQGTAKPWAAVIPLRVTVTPTSNASTAPQSLCQTPQHILGQLLELVPFDARRCIC